LQAETCQIFRWAGCGNRRQPQAQLKKSTLYAGIGKLDIGIGHIGIGIGYSGYRLYRYRQNIG
jgi:hypothetical protein